MYPFHWYLIISGLLAAAGIQKKWYGLAVLAILFFIYVLFSTLFVTVAIN